ncbi:hypothetical protein ASG22_19220 [Chryseobacterium sp. Leaf405]|uniref:hypothetical protein n=1 Tax=Chryseobacterium sp. Leaf405 TaxID=1736367 RepID=UPI000701F40B|nr:hypothetical protein [Chryseobacterium sp. Leaf405]KQT30943.1 hypothetical protein ASG22_19220 [Chryseobacterium sp. Leaf405]
MKLIDFNILSNKISFNNPYYANLENLLNSNFNKPTTLHSYLKEILIVVENWGNDTLDFHLKNLFGGYWDEEGLKAYNVEGKWFTFFCYDDLHGYIHLESKTFYLENSILINEAIIEMPLDEFVDVLKQWKTIIDIEK